MLDELPKVRVEDFFNYADLFHWILLQVRDEAKNNPQMWDRCIKLVDRVLNIFPEISDLQRTSHPPIEIPFKGRLALSDFEKKALLEKCLNHLIIYAWNKAPVISKSVLENVDFAGGAEVLVLIQNNRAYKFCPTNKYYGHMGFTTRNLTSDVGPYSGVVATMDPATPEQYVQRVQTVNELKICIPCQIKGMTESGVLITEEPRCESLEDFCERKNLSPSAKQAEWLKSIRGIWLRNEVGFKHPEGHQLLIWNKETHAFWILADAHDWFVDSKGNVLMNDFMPYKVTAADLAEHPDLRDKAIKIATLQRERDPDFVLPTEYADVLGFPSDTPDVAASFKDHFKEPHE